MSYIITLMHSKLIDLSTRITNTKPMMIVWSEKNIKNKTKTKTKKNKKKKKNTFSYKNKGSEGIVTHESSHNNDVQNFNSIKFMIRKIN